MKIKTTTSFIILLSPVALALTGCQQTRLIFHPTVRQSRAVPSPVSRQSRAVPNPVSRESQSVPGPVRLAAAQDHPRVEPVSTDPPATEPASNQASSDAVETVEVVRVVTADQERPVVAYTPPPAWVRQFVLAVVATIGLTEGASDAGAGKEVSESLVHSAAGVTGRLGLTSPGTTVDGAVGQRLGTSGGPVGGIGFGSTNNIYTLQGNPATGPGGRCAELARAGLTANHAPCAGGARGH